MYTDYPSFCNILFILAVWIDIDPQTAPPVTPPVNIRADRTNNSEAMVRFEPQSLGKFEIDLYVANDSNTPYLVRFD